MIARSRRLLPLLAIALAAAIAVAVATRSPLRRDDPALAAWVESRIPPGTALAEARARALHHGWYRATAQGSDGRTRGPYLRGELGHYGWPTKTSVTVFWEFDAEGRLARTRLWRTVDAP